MSTHNIALTAHQGKLLDALVQSGRYRNAGEVFREGLRLIEAREAEDTAKLEALSAAAQLGIAALDRGDFKEFPNAAALAEHVNLVAERVRMERDAE